MELMIAIDAARHASAARITAVIPIIPMPGRTKGCPTYFITGRLIATF